MALTLNTSLSDRNKKALSPGFINRDFNTDLSHGWSPKPGLGAYAGAAGGLVQLGNQFFGNMQVPDLPQYDFNALSKGDLFSRADNFSGYDAGRTSVGGNTASGALTGATAGMAFGPVGALAGGLIGGIAGGLGSLFGNKRKQREENRLNRLAINQINSQNTSINSNLIHGALSNQLAYGGILPMTSMVNDQLRMNGNNLFAYGGHFDNGVTQFNTGGSHSENPFGGIMQGIGQNGEPNMVEEGEVKWNDYIFSDRINTPKEEDDMLKLSKGILNKTFADAALYLSKESEERPNDPISKRGLNDSLSKLAMLQEMNRPIEPDEGGNQFPTGGYLTLGNNNSRFFNYTPDFTSNNFRTSTTQNRLPIYTDEEIMAHAKSVFGDNIEDALEVLVGEGGYDWQTGKFNPYAYASNIMKDWVLNEDRGLAQVSSRYHPDFLDYYDPIKSLSYMGEITKGGTDFSPYVSYTKGNDAINAYRASKGLSPLGTRQTADTPVVSNQKDGSSNTPTPTPSPTPTTLDTDGDRMERWMGLQERIFQRDLDRDTAMAERDRRMQDLMEKEANRPNTMRYAPLFTNLGMLASSYAETPDNLRLGRIAPTPVTERLEYRPIDNEYIANQMRQQAAGATRGVIDTAGGNRAMASAGLRSINRSTQDAIGAGLFQGRQYNDALRREVQGFNRDTSIQNAQSDLMAQQFNTQAYNKEQEYRKQSEAAWRNMQRQGWAGIGNILGDIGRENRFFRMAPILSGGYNAQGIMGANREGFGFKDGGFMKFYKRKIK